MYVYTNIPYCYPYRGHHPRQAVAYDDVLQHFCVLINVLFSCIGECSLILSVVINVLSSCIDELFFLAVMKNDICSNDALGLPYKSLKFYRTRFTYRKAS